MDKAGHAFSAYHESLASYRALRWAGVSKKKALIYGGTAGIVCLLYTSPSPRDATLSRMPSSA